ncbi:MAG: hypothetical protein AAF961_14015, partial [Planctomycetota bacterium]
RDIEVDGKTIHVVNYRSEYDPFTIGDFQGGDVYGGELTEYSVFPSWNHWPVAQMPSDGRYATYPDRTSHSSLTHVRLPTYKEDLGVRPYEQRILLEGMTNKSPQELAKLSRSWLSPPEIDVTSGGESAGYEPGQRAYLLDATEGELAVTLRATEKSPVVNPCFVIRNWATDDATVSVQGPESAATAEVRVGKPRTVRTHDLVVWVELESVEPTTFVISTP